MVDRVARSVRNYEAKLRLGACGRLSEEALRRRVEGYAYRAWQQEVIRVQTRQALCNHGVVAHMFPMYHAYSRQLGKLKRQDCSADAREAMLETIAAKWIARGLDEAPLREVAECVFNLHWPYPARERPS